MNAAEAKRLQAVREGDPTGSMGGEILGYAPDGTPILETESGFQVRTFPGEQGAGALQRKVLKAVGPWWNDLSAFNVSVTTQTDIPPGTGSKNGVYHWFFNLDAVDDLPEGLRPRAGSNYTNPGLREGRGQPCPCGSGVKAKRCCGVRREALGTITIDNLSVRGEGRKGVGKAVVQALHDAGFDLQASTILPPSRGFWDRIGFRTVSAEEYIDLDPVIIDWPEAQHIEGTYGPHGYRTTVPHPDDTSKARGRRASELGDTWDDIFTQHERLAANRAAAEALSKGANFDIDSDQMVIFGSGDKYTQRESIYGWLDANEPLLRLRALAATESAHRAIRPPRIWNPVTRRMIQNTSRNRRSVVRQYHRRLHSATL